MVMFLILKTPKTTKKLTIIEKKSNIGDELLQQWNVKCSDINNNGKTHYFKKSNKSKFAYISQVSYICAIYRK